MRCRSLRIALLVVIAAWFGVVVPLHPRGIVRLAGACEAEGRACCRPVGTSTREDPSKSKHVPVDGCAVCQFVATLDLPPAIGIDVPPLGLIEQLNVPAPLEAPVIAWGDAHPERGPPIEG